MSFKKALVIAALSAGIVYGGYEVSKRFVVSSYKSVEEQKHHLNLVEARISSLEGSLDQFSNKNHDYYRNHFQSDRGFVDSVARNTASNNAYYVFSLMPSQAKTNLVNLNYDFLTKESRKAVAVDYAKEEIDKKKKDFVNFVNEYGKKLEEAPGVGRLVKAKIAISQKCRELIHGKGCDNVQTNK